MNRILMGLLAVWAMAGCASSGVKEQKANLDGSNSATNAASLKPKGAAVAESALGREADNAKAASGSSIYFDFDSAVVKPEYRDTLARGVQYLAKHPSTKAVIEGNCDERGSDEYNLALGQRRADAEEKAMLTMGAHLDQLKTMSYGRERPKATCHDESCWKENRRADLDFQG